MSFLTRFGPAAEHERAVRAAIVRAGWTAQPFGQGQLTDDMITILADMMTELRWAPDIVAGRRYNGRSEVVLVDAKTGRKDTGNYCVEIKSAWSMRATCGAWHLPGLFVMCDYRVMSLIDVLLHGRPQDFRWSEGRSGTPGYLIPKRYAREFHETFGGNPIPPEPPSAPDLPADPTPEEQWRQEYADYIKNLPDDDLDGPPF